MIKFFRKIRQNLLMENKTGKYFKYAIGEIILVVIGILIALQLNTWNEQQKKSKLKNEYVVSLKNDLTKDTIQLNRRLSLNKQMLKDLALIRDDITNGNIRTKEDFIILFESNIGTSVRLINTYNTNTFNLLISSGNIDLLDKQLREDIMELNRLQKYQKEITTSNRDYFFSFMERISIKYPNSDNPFNPEGINELLWKGVNLDELPRDVTSYLGQRGYTIHRYIELTQNVLSKTEKILKQLKNQG
jgi:hypothetical protein